ncbi:MAG: hypothetical protein K5910_06115 [Bacteroidales bacterium]|nr:hypothetical protein [Bacteroidales bacterium]
MKNFNENDRAVYARREEEGEFLFCSSGPFWHLCTPGTEQENIFLTPDDFRFGVTSAALCLRQPVRIYASAVMSNHLHDIVSGPFSDCLDYFDRRKRKIKSYLHSQGRTVDLRYFSVSPIPVNSLDSLRREIVYVNRNGYVVHPGHTPFSYPWSTGAYYFNPAAKAGGIPYNELSYKEKRSLCQGRIVALPDSVRVKDGMIHMPSFISLETGERLFRDAHQYFNLLSRSSEAYGEVARRLGDSVYLTDDELFTAVCSICRKQYGLSRPTSLAPNDKISLAVEMKQRYNASNGQIRRMLRLENRIVQELFPG